MKIIDMKDKNPLDINKLIPSYGSSYTGIEETTREILVNVREFGDSKLMKIIWKPENNIEIDDETLIKLDRLLEMIDDNDDVQDIYFNFDFPEDYMV